MVADSLDKNLQHQESSLCDGQVYSISCSHDSALAIRLCATLES